MITLGKLMQWIDHSQLHISPFTLFSGEKPKTPFPEKSRSHCSLLAAVGSQLRFSVVASTGSQRSFSVLHAAELGSPWELPPRLLDLANNTGHSVKLEFQRNSKQFLLQEHARQDLGDSYSLKKKVVYLKFNFDQEYCILSSNYTTRGSGHVPEIDAVWFAATAVITGGRFLQSLGPSTVAFSQNSFPGFHSLSLFVVGL